MTKTQKAKTYEVTVTPKMITYGLHRYGDEYTVEIDAFTASEAITKVRRQRNESEGRYGVRATYRARVVAA